MDSAAWNPGGRIYPRYYPGYNTKVVLEKVNDDVQEYRYSSGPAADAQYVSGRSLAPPEEPYRPFEFASYYKPVTPPIPVIHSAPQPTRTVPETCSPKRFYGQRYRFLGYTIIILALLTFAFELADVIVAANYMLKPCNSQTVTNSFTIPWFFSWVVPGIWGSIPIFISGILSMYVKTNFGKVFQALAILAALSALFFAPAIIAINAAEIATFLQYCNYTSVANAGSVADEGAKFALPIILLILGGILFLLLLYLTYLLCISYDECYASETVVIKGQQPTTSVTTTTAAVVPFQPGISVPLPYALPSVDYIPAPATLPPPPPRDLGPQGRAFFVEAHNRGYAYASVPGYFTTNPNAAATPLAPGVSGFYWK